MIEIKCYPVGELQANCYYIFDTDQEISFVVDPGDYSSELEEQIIKDGTEKVMYILLTHGHFDHIGYTSTLHKLCPSAKIVIGKGDSGFTSNDILNLSSYFSGEGVEHFKADVEASDNDSLSFGQKAITVLNTPGHTTGGVCYILEDIIFTGDTIISGTTGRTDFPTGSNKEMLASVNRIRNLEGDYRMFCGHGESTTLEYERKHNYIMRDSVYEDIY